MASAQLKVGSAQHRCRLCWGTARNATTERPQHFVAHPLLLLSSQCWPQPAQMLVGGTGEVWTAHGTVQPQAGLVLLPR